MIDDDYDKGWEALFGYMFKDIYGDLISFECLHDITNETVKEAYDSNPDALFIQDNNLGNCTDKGIQWIRTYGGNRAIILHTADVHSEYDLMFKAAEARALMVMIKDNPQNPMGEREMKRMIVNFHRNIIRHFKLVPELMWIVYMRMNIKDTDL